MQDPGGAVPVGGAPGGGTRTLASGAKVRGHQPLGTGLLLQTPWALVSMSTYPPPPPPVWAADLLQACGWI